VITSHTVEILNISLKDLLELFFKSNCELGFNIFQKEELPTKNCWATEWFVNKEDLLEKHNWTGFKNIEKSVFNAD
jgi:hypothetical protein